jgi:hypothetical protein
MEDFCYSYVVSDLLEDCGPSLTYQVNGPSVEFLGTGDLLDSSALKHLELIGAFDFGEHSSFQHKVAPCDFTIHCRLPRTDFTDSLPRFKDLTVG